MINNIGIKIINLSI